MIISGDPSLTGQEEATEFEIEGERRNFEVPVSLHGKRLDVALVALAPEFSRSYLQQLIEAGFVSIDGQAISKPSAKVRAGASGTVELQPTPQSQAFRPEVMDIPVIFRDEHLLVINKPAGLVVHPAPGNWSGTLLNGLLALDPEAGALPRAGIVHRLDKYTSGLMLVARTRIAMDALVKMIAAREVNRQYLAFISRPWLGSQVREVDAAIGRDTRNRLRMAVVDPTLLPGKPARTTFELVEATPPGCLIRCTLHTGRTHQIRVHLSSLGCPLIDDEIYGGKAIANPGRQALHASRLSLVHPVRHEPLSFQAALPADLVKLAAMLGLRYNDD